MACRINKIALRRDFTSANSIPESIEVLQRSRIFVPKDRFCLSRIYGECRYASVFRMLKFIEGPIIHLPCLSLHCLFGEIGCRFSFCIYICPVVRKAVV
jgi:hypothetical protein